jgi:hypothetical protein
VRAGGQCRGLAEGARGESGGAIVETAADLGASSPPPEDHRGCQATGQRVQGDLIDRHHLAGNDGSLGREQVEDGTRRKIGSIGHIGLEAAA